MDHTLSATIMRAAGLVTDGKADAIWVVRKMDTAHFMALSPNLALAMINAGDAELTLKVSR